MPSLIPPPSGCAGTSSTRVSCSSACWKPWDWPGTSRFPRRRRSPAARCARPRTPSRISKPADDGRLRAGMMIPCARPAVRTARPAEQRMLFNGYPFLLVFLPASIAIYRLADPHPRARMAVLVLLSLVFYGYDNPRYVLLLAASIAVNWLAAQAYGRYKVKSIITAAIVMNLAVLGFFKYTNFALGNLGFLLDRPMPQLDIALPLGISFFTFHHIMYLVDLRRGRAPMYPA